MAHSFISFFFSIFLYPILLHQFQCSNDKTYIFTQDFLQICWLSNRFLLPLQPPNQNWAHELALGSKYHLTTYSRHGPGSRGSRHPSSVRERERENWRINLVLLFTGFSLQLYGHLPAVKSFCTSSGGSVGLRDGSVQYVPWFGRSKDVREKSGRRFRSFLSTYGDMVPIMSVPSDLGS